MKQEKKIKNLLEMRRSINRKEDFILPGYRVNYSMQMGDSINLLLLHTEAIKVGYNFESHPCGVIYTFGGEQK